MSKDAGKEHSLGHGINPPRRDNYKASRVGLSTCTGRHTLTMCTLATDMRQVDGGSMIYGI